MFVSVLPVQCCLQTSYPQNTSFCAHLYTITSASSSESSRSTHSHVTFDPVPQCGLFLAQKSVLCHRSLLCGKRSVFSECLVFDPSGSRRVARCLCSVSALCAHRPYVCGDFVLYCSVCVRERGVCCLPTRL